MTGDGPHHSDTGRWLDPGQRQSAARDAYRRSVDAGTPLTAAELAAQFNRSPRWAQDRIAEARRQRSELLRPGSANGSGDMDNAAVGPPHAASHAVTGSRAQRVDTLIVALVALVAAAASYQHQRTLAALAGEGWLAWALPISVDGMMLATGRSILRRRRAGIPTTALSWFGFTLGFVASVAANVAAAHPPLWAGSLPPGRPSPCSSPTRPSPLTTGISPTLEGKDTPMGLIFDDLEDHEGFAARRLPDGALTSTWTQETDAFTGYVAACTCGWTGGHKHPPTEMGRTAAEDQWEDAHAWPLLAAAVPGRVTELVDNLRKEIAELADDRPLAARTVAHRLATWSEHVLQRTATADLGHRLDGMGRDGRGQGLGH